MSRASLSLVAIVAGLSALAFLLVPFGFAAYPGQFFDEAHVGPVPFWVTAIFLAALNLLVCLAAGTKALRSPRR